MRIQREARQGEMLPRGYGVAWVDFCRGLAICYPIPLNRILGTARRLYLNLAAAPRGPEIAQLRGRILALEAMIQHYRERDAADQAFAERIVREVVRREEVTEH